MTVDKTIYDKRDLKRLNGNVIKLPVIDKWWLIKEEEKENNDDKESRKKRKIKLASYEPEIDDAIMAMEYWTERFENHRLRNKFKTLREFISWSMSNEDQP